MIGEEKKFWRLSNPVLWGVLATVVVGLFAWLVLGLPTCAKDVAGAEACEKKWATLLNAKPNEIGDTLAGFAGVLAFVWIIVTVAMQAEELKAQREELSLTRREFEQISEAQRRQVEFMQAQTELLSEQNSQINAQARGKIALQKFEELRDGIFDLISSGVTVALANNEIRHFGLIDLLPKKVSNRQQIRNLETRDLLQTIMNAYDHYQGVISEFGVLRVPLELIEVKEKILEVERWAKLSDEVTKQKLYEFNLGHVGQYLNFEAVKI